MIEINQKFTNILLFDSDSRLAFNKINQQELEKYYKSYLMGVVKYLYKINDIIISEKNILKYVSYRANEVIQFLMNADKVKNHVRYTVLL